jgi:hypothetical protein
MKIFCRMPTVAATEDFCIFLRFYLFVYRNVTSGVITSGQQQKTAGRQQNQYLIHFGFTSGT